MLRPIRGAVISSVLISSTAGAQEHGGHQHGDGRHHTLGSVAFENPGNAAAQAPFQRGVALLHSFEYSARARLRDVWQQADEDVAVRTPR